MPKLTIPYCETAFPILLNPKKKSSVLFRFLIDDPAAIWYEEKVDVLHRAE